MTSDKRANVEIQGDLIRVSIHGFDFADKRDRFPRVKDDKGLVREFQLWLIEVDIVPLHVPSQGAGSFIGYFHDNDFEKILAWLQERNKSKPIIAAKIEHGIEEKLCRVPGCASCAERGE